MLYYLDLLGTLAFAITGAYKAKGAKLNIAGVIFLGAITALGGGTIRDLIIGRTSLFYLKDLNYFIICVIAGILVYIIPVIFQKGYSFFRLMDSIGLAAFVIIGVSVAGNFGFIPSVFLGMLTGFGGGIIRDSIMSSDVPMSLKKGSNYALSAFLGAASFYLLMFINVQLAMAVSIIITLAMREIISKYGIINKLILKEYGRNK
ncbi:MAG: TRIC cation channel family protein [Candidatus Nealsonbacteria bacterium]|nr:TRIC cation channel family protein [Candidatus Nealsonbacteria bacterium]